MRLQSFVDDDGQERRLVWRVGRVVRDGARDRRRADRGRAGQRMSTAARAWSPQAPWLAAAGGPGWEAPRREFGPRRSRGTAGGAGRGRLPPWLARVRPASGRTGLARERAHAVRRRCVNRRPHGLGGRTGG